MRTYTLLQVILFLTVLGYSQEKNLKKIILNPPILNTDSIIKVGINLHDEKKYEDAIYTFELINENDSNYVLAQYELANSYLSLKKDSITIEICDNILNIDKSYYSKLLLLKANAYDGLKQYNKSAELYQKGIKEFPLSAQFYHEFAISNYNQKKYKEAKQNYINAININPKYAPSHFQLGLLSLKQQKIIPAMLSFQFYLLIDNSSQRAKTIVKLLEQIADDEINYSDFESINEIENNDDFSDLEAIVKSKAAFNEKFKTKVDLNYRVLKQIQVVLDKIDYNVEDKGFCTQFYAKFFKELASKKHTETYLYYLLSEMGIEDVNKWMKNNKSQVDEFSDWYYTYVRQNLSETNFEENLPSKKGFKVYSYNNIVAVGNLNDNKEKIGYWKYYFTSSLTVKSEGAYDQFGKRTGPWKYYYENGKIKETCNFKNDNIDGEYYKYYSSGKILNHLFYKDGEFDGKQSVYYSNENLKNTYNYKNGLFEGEEIGYYQTGKINYKVDVIAGKYNGNYTLYFENGSIQKLINFNKGIKEGVSKEYYNYPKEVIYAEGVYENDYPTGEWKYYFNNGKIFSSGLKNKKGLKDGLWKEFLKNGTLSKEDLYSDGKTEGISKNYDRNGNLYEEYFYRKNKINQYKFYSSNGKLEKEIIKQKNEFNFELNNRNGTTRLIGKLVGEEIEGELINYNYLGLKSEIKEYKDGKKTNKEIKYYSNGQVLSTVNYISDKMEGLYEKNFVNGNPLTRGYYINNTAEGYWFYYDKNGPISEIKYYVNGEKSGWQRMFACNGKLFRAERIEDGRVAERCYYDTIGKIIKRINYDICNDCQIEIPNVDEKPWIKRNLKNNFIHGKSATYYPNGSINFESTYDMELEIGVSKSFDLYGKLIRETNYDFDNKQGKQIIYENGKPEYIANYQNNSLNGETIDYYYNGKMFQKANYENGDYEGEFIRYDDAENKAIVLNYENDNLISYSYEKEDGTLLPATEIKSPNAEVKAYYKNKKPSASFTIKNGEKEGLYVLLSSTGNKLLEENFSFGYLNGPRIEYFGNGKIKSKSNFNFGDFNGVYKEYFENGNIRYEFNYVNGTRHGISKYYDINGKVEYNCFYYDDYILKILK